MKNNMTHTEKIKEFLFEKPEIWFHIREIARALKISPNTVKSILSNLIKEKIIEKRILSNLFQVRANLDNENYKIEKKLYNLFSLYKSNLISYLDNYYSNPTIVLFGSYSRGEDISSSDIDIGIITPEKKQPSLENFERKLKRKINLFLFTKKEISKEFFTNLINGIVLKGVLK